MQAYRTPGKHSRVDVEAFLEFLTKYKMPIPPEFDAAKQKRRILIVDDDQRIVDMIRAALTLEKHYKCDVAMDGFTAGEKFSEFHPDLVVLDINMPGLNGFEVCSHLRFNLKDKNVKIIAISGNTQPEVKAKVIKTGANDFLAKPFQVGELVKKIEKLLGLSSGKDDEDVLESYRR